MKEVIRKAWARYVRAWRLWRGLYGAKVVVGEPMPLEMRRVPVYEWDEGAWTVYRADVKAVKWDGEALWAYIPGGGWREVATTEPGVVSRMAKALCSEAEDCEDAAVLAYREASDGFEY